MGTFDQRQSTTTQTPSSTDAPRRTSGAIRRELRGRSLAEQQSMLSPGSQSYASQSAQRAPQLSRQERRNQFHQRRHERQLQQETDGILSELAGWADFAWTAMKNVQFSGMIDRTREVFRIVDAVASGGDVAALGIDPNDHRLRNVAEMHAIVAQSESGVGDDRLAAEGLRDANAVFYVLLGNGAGRFDGMDMERYRQIGRLSVDEAAEVLPEFEAELFAAQTDEATIEFGDSLSAKHRGDLFDADNTTRDLAHYGGQAVDAIADAGQAAIDWTRDLLGL